MSKHKGLKLAPIHPQGLETVWFYESKNGLEVYVNAADNRPPIQFVISYRSIEAYMKRRSKA